MTRLKKLKDIYVAVIKMFLSFLRKNTPVKTQVLIGLKNIRLPTIVLVNQELESTLLIRRGTLIEAEY